MDPYIGMIQPFAFPWAPSDWALCNGQSLPVSQYAAVNALIGSVFGGSGSGSSATINLPDLRGRTILGEGVSALSGNSYQWGKKFGAETASISLTTLADHSHNATFGAGSTPGVKVTLQANPATTPNVPAPTTTNNCLAGSPAGTGNALMWATSTGGTAAVTVGGLTTTITGGGNITGGVVTLANTGGGTAVSLMNPVLVVNFCFALQGWFPPRP